MIDLTPLEVRKKKGDFRRAMRGYEPALVDDFIDLVADRLEQLVRDNMALNERIARQDQQVTEYRERERALTEALVTAQEMREEMRQQTMREAELAKRTAEQESAQLRSSAQQESTQLRSSAQQEAQQLRAAAQQEVQQLRSAVEREAAELRASALREREREEEAVRHLRMRQEQFLATYRAFLERELSEVGMISQTLGGAPAGPGATSKSQGTPAAASLPLPPSAPLPPPPAVPLPPSAAREPELARAAAPPIAAEPALPSAAVPPPAEAQAPTTMVGGAPLTLTPPPATSDDGMTGEPSLTLSADDMTEPGPDEGMSPYDAAAPMDFEPFAPEPFEPEPFEPESAEDEDDPHALPPLIAGEAAAATADASLYDGIVPLEGDGVPGPIGLAPSEAAWGPDFAADDEEEEEEDEETSRLLRNAAAAGYRVPEEDELLLDEPIEEPTEPEKKGDGWLPNLLEDES